MTAEIKERRRGAWLGSSNRRRDAEVGRQGERGTIDQGGLGYQACSNIARMTRQTIRSSERFRVPR
jgi:hypothetical protein